MEQITKVRKPVVRTNFMGRKLELGIMKHKETGRAFQNEICKSTHSDGVKKIHRVPQLPVNSVIVQTHFRSSSANHDGNKLAISTKIGNGHIF